MNTTSSEQLWAANGVPYPIQLGNPAIIITNGSKYTITSTALSVDRTINIPDPGADSFFITGSGLQTMTQKTVDQSGFVNGEIFNSTAQFPTTGGTPATLDYYESTTFQSTFGGAFSPATATQTFRVVRLGRQVTIEADAFSAASTASSLITSNAALPSRFRPLSTNRPFIIQGTNNAGSNLYAPILVIIGTDGSMNFAGIDYTTFTTGRSNTGWDAFSVTYLV